jgi:acid phosphatase type 7
VQAKKILIRLSITIGVIFVISGLLVYPIWNDLNANLGGKLPLIQLLIVAGSAYIGYCYDRLKSSKRIEKRVKIHTAVMVISNLLMLGLLGSLFWELGWGVVLLFRTLTQNLTAIFGASVIIFVVIYWPRWHPLAKRTKVIALVSLAIVALIRISLPWQVNFTALPVVFLQQEGLIATWGTNMYATHEIRYGSTPVMENLDRPQAHGLQPIDDGIASAYLPGQPEGQELFLKVSVNGIRQIKRSSTVKGGTAETPVMQFDFPLVDNDLYLVSFSDIHEINIAYKLLAQYVPWKQVDYALFLGDFVIDVGEPKDLVENLLQLPTGGLNIPRVLVRGNHETRGAGARALSEIFLPPGGSWYYTFSHGDTFFIVLDSGEDKPDSHIEYAGVIDFKSYHLEQAEWLANIFETPKYKNARYKIVLVHIPPFETKYMSPAYLPIVNLLKAQTDIDLVMSGHLHRGGIWMPDETGWPYPITTNGGPLLVDTEAVTAQLTEEGIQLELFNILGNTLESEWIPAK